MKLTPYKRDKELLKLFAEKNRKSYPVKGNASHKIVRKALENEMTTYYNLLDEYTVLEVYNKYFNFFNDIYEVYQKICTELDRFLDTELKVKWQENTEVLSVDYKLHNDEDYYFIKVKFFKKIITLTYDYQVYGGSCEDGTSFQAYNPQLREIITSKCETAIAQFEKEYYRVNDDDSESYEVIDVNGIEKKPQLDKFSDQYHDFELKDSFDSYTINNYPDKKKYDASDIRECVILSCKWSTENNNKPYFILCCANGYYISQSIDITSANYKVYQVIGNKIFLGIPKFKDSKVPPVITSDPQTGQFELFQTEDRQLALF